MNKNIFFSVSAVMLFIAYAFAYRINKVKQTGVATFFYKTPGGICKVGATSMTFSKFYTVGTQAAFLNTCVSTTTGPLYATSKCTTKRVFLCP